MLGFDTSRRCVAAARRRPPPHRTDPAQVKVVILYFVLPTVFLVQLSNFETIKNFIQEYNVTVADVWILATLGVLLFGRVFVLGASTASSCRSTGS